MTEKLQQAIHLIQSGDRQAGRQQLAALLAEDPKNETAWLWLAGAVDTDEQRLYCVKQVLKLNPSNQAALRALESLERDQVPPTDTIATTQPAGPPASDEPSPPAGAALSNQELVEFVVHELKKDTQRNDIIYKLCERTGMTWPQAEAFVGEIEADQGPQIARRRAPLLIVVGLVTITIGAILALPNLSFFIQFLKEPAAYVSYVPFLWRKTVILVVGLGMVAGGLYGILRAIAPSSGGLVEEMAAGGDRYKSMDDLVDVGIWLGGSGDHRGRRRRGTRLL